MNGQASGGVGLAVAAWTLLAPVTVGVIAVTMVYR